MSKILTLPIEADVPCPSCGAATDEPCTTKDGRPGRHAHNARRRASIAAFEERQSLQGVLHQPCPTCGAQPGTACTSIRDGYSTLDDFHARRPDGYTTEA